MARKFTLPSFSLNIFSARGLLGLIILTTIIPHVGYAVSISDFNLPPQDANGWTVLQPDPDSRIVYVDSSSGNDTTGQVYSPSDSVIGSNPQSPTGSVQAFQTLAAAYDQLRSDAPDWMLLKSGEVWEGESLKFHRGKSDTKRTVVSSYGSGARPELRTGTLKGIDQRSASNVIVSGIKFWAHTRDSDESHFLSYDGAFGFNFYNGNGRVRDVLFEDCVFRAYAGNIITGSVGSSNNPPTERFVLRRSIISGNYSTAGHSQGLYHTGKGQSSTGPASILLEENLFDHNGWSSAVKATIFNHNTYFSDAKKVMFIGNIFMRASSMHNKWTANSGPQSASQVVMDNNLYAEGEIGIGAGGNKAGAYRFELFKIQNNVFTDIGRTFPTGRSLAWYMEIIDWDNGKITGNLLLNQTAGINNTFAINFTAPDGTRKIEVKNNYIYNMEAASTSNRALVKFKNGDNTTDVNFADNIIQAPHKGPVVEINIKNSYQFTGENGYFSNGDPAEWFVISNNKYGLTDWISYTGDNNAVIAPPEWNDPDRNLERYASEVGLESGFNNLIDALYDQSKSSWRSDLTATKINNWFREGFVTGISNTQPTASFTVTCTDLACNFDASKSSDPNGNILKYDWVFGDGNTLSNQYPNHVYVAAGTYTVTLTVTDNDGETDTFSQSVTVTAALPMNVAPTASFTASTSELTAVFADTSSDSDGRIVSWAWGFGDGSTSIVQNPSHTYVAAGTYTVTLTVTDNSGATNTFSQSVTASATSASDAIQLIINAVDPTKFGWSYEQVFSHEAGITYEFTGNGEDRELHLTAYDVDNATELSLILNGYRIGYLDPGANNSLTAAQVFDIPASLQVDGANFIEIREKRAGWRWGVTDVGLFDKYKITSGIQIISPADGTSVTSKQTFMVKTNLTSSNNIQKVDFWHDSWNHFGHTTSAPYEMLMDEVLTGDNPHIIRARVIYTDNSTETHTIYVNVN